MQMAQNPSIQTYIAQGQKLSEPVIVKFIFRQLFIAQKKPLLKTHLFMYICKFCAFGDDT